MQFSSISNKNNYSKRSIVSSFCLCSLTQITVALLWETAGLKTASLLQLPSNSLLKLNLFNYATIVIYVLWWIPVLSRLKRWFTYLERGIKMLILWWTLGVREIPKFPTLRLQHCLSHLILAVKYSICRHLFSSSIPVLRTQPCWRYSSFHSEVEETCTSLISWVVLCPGYVYFSIADS